MGKVGHCLIPESQTERVRDSLCSVRDEIERKQNSRQKCSVVASMLRLNNVESTHHDHARAKLIHERKSKTKHRLHDQCMTHTFLNTEKPTKPCLRLRTLFINDTNLFIDR